ncbi:MAG: hypothetical protein O7C67_11215 [Gammaproteobacteria bacterium]|nr:hypothetical protein [Gammaproteobacteria bacterium]
MSLQKILTSRHRGKARFLWMALSVAVAGCMTYPASPTAPSNAIPAQFPTARYAAMAPNSVYTIKDAELLIKTYPAGWLKRLSHSHAMTTEQIGGLIYMANSVDASFADLYMRPYDLVIDAADVRAALGAGFERRRSDRAKAATRARMLGSRMLSATEYPFVHVHVQPRTHTALLSIRLKADEHHATVPLTWARQGDCLFVASRFTLSHRDLALRGYYAFLGAIGVAEDIDFELRILAARGTNPACDKLPND